MLDAPSELLLDALGVSGGGSRSPLNVEQSTFADATALRGGGSRSLLSASGASVASRLILCNGGPSQETTRVPLGVSLTWDATLGKHQSSWASASQEGWFTPSSTRA